MKCSKDYDVCCITKEEIIPTEEDKEIQCQLIGRYSIETFILNPKAIQFYTGFKSFEHFMFLLIVDTVDSDIWNSKESSISSLAHLSFIKVRKG
jgi:hypothetical protein